jgi:hypothetical protein
MHSCRYLSCETLESTLHKRMLLATFASLQRVRGPTHPNTLAAARGLGNVRASIRAQAADQHIRTGYRRRGAIATRWHSRASAAARRQARAQRQARARAVVRRAHRPICRGAGRRDSEEAVAEGRVRGACRVRGGRMRVGGGRSKSRTPFWRRL